MTRIPTIKTTFTSGEVSPDLLGRGDLNAYDNGALKLRNVFIQPTGAIMRRSGLRYIDTALGKGRMMAFEFNSEQTYLLVLTHQKLSIYAGDVLEVTLTAPWSESDIQQLAWTQSADTLLLTHPDYPPRRLIRSGLGVWSIVNWEFYNDGGRLCQPMYKFAGSAVTLTPSATTGTITVTASASVFESGHVGTRLRIGNKEVQIVTVASPTVVSATVLQTLISTTATVDWEKQSFSSVRGYPTTAAFHQDRLVIGGSRDLPNRIWMSQSGDLFNFDLGTGLDSEAIEFGIFSDQVNAIRGVFSGRHLQVFTSGSEWMVTGDPLTPANVQIKRQTRVGSMIDRYISPIDVDGSTLFVARNGQELREFIYTSIEEAYQSTDLALLSHHIITTPVDQDFDQKRRLLFLVRADGQFATLTVYRAESVAAWTLHDTAGQVISVSVVGDNVYLLIKRGTHYFIELVDDTLHLDAALSGESATATTTWAGLDYLNGNMVSVVGDGKVEANKTVALGQITTDHAVHKLQAGLPFTHIIEPLPPSNISEIGYSRAVRLVEATFRISNTAALTLDVGRGLKDISLRQLGETSILDAAPPIVSGDIKVRAYGWKNDTSKPLWRIVRLDAGSIETAIYNLLSASDGSAIWDFSGGNYTAYNAGYPYKNKLQKSICNDLTSTLQRYDTEYIDTSGTFNLDLSHSVHLVSSFGGALTINLPNASTAAGAMMVVKKIDSSKNIITVSEAGGGAGPDGTSYFLGGENDFVMVMSNGAEWFVISSNRSPGNTRFYDGTGIYDIDMAVDVYLLSSFGGALNARLPPANSKKAIGRQITIKKTDVSSNAVTVTVQGESGPDQYNQPLSAQFQSITVVSDGGQWFVIGRYP